MHEEDNTLRGAQDSIIAALTIDWNCFQRFVLTIFFQDDDEDFNNNFNKSDSDSASYKMGIEI